MGKGIWIRGPNIYDKGICKRTTATHTFETYTGFIREDSYDYLWEIS